MCAPSLGKGKKEVLLHGPCPNWGKGQLPRGISVSRSKLNKGRQRSLNLTAVYDVPGQWDAGTIDWRPTSNNEYYRFYSLQDMQSCLAGQRIYIQGDSMLRQLFMHLVKFNRELPTQIGQYWHDQVTVYTV